MIQRKGDYGFDAPYVPLGMMATGAILGALATWRGHGGDFGGAAMMGTFAVSLFVQAGIYVHSTRRGKFRAWDDVLASLALDGSERVLDLGCGRGAVLLLAAQRLPRGRATGIDLWSTTDQSGNAAEVTKRNAELEGVTERVELHTVDMCSLPFADGSFDVVVSSLAIHNIPTADGRARAIREAVRVVRPGGRFAIADFRFTADYARELRAAGIEAVDETSLGARFWYGGPWAATKLVRGRKPAATPIVDPN